VNNKTVMQDIRLRYTG